MLNGRLDLLRSKTPALLGMDISSSAVKLVELSDSTKGLSLEHYAIEPLPKDAVVDGNIANLEEVSSCARRAWTRLETRIRNVAMALPAAAVITKKIILPASLREAEMEVQVETEANQYIPFPLDEVNLDFQVLGPAPQGPEEIEVLIAASRKDKVEDRVAAAEAAGLKAVVMDVESFAMQSAFHMVEKRLPGSSPKQPIAIFDIGAQVMNLHVLQHGQIIYSREQPFGGNLLTQEIQRHFNLASEEAEMAKRNGGLPDNYQADVLAPFCENLALEVARALQFFFTSTQFSQLSQIVLAGGCAALPGLTELVAGRGEAPTVVANAFSGMSCSSKIRPRNLGADAPSLFIACGLAMRRFDAS